MSKSGEIAFKFGDGMHAFRLDFQGFVMIEDALGVGPRKLLRSILNADEGAKWAHEIVRITLIRAGMAPLEALHLVELYIDNRPAKEWAPAMLLIVQAGFGFEEKKSEDDSDNPSEATTTTTYSPTSSATVQ